MNHKYKNLPKFFLRSHGTEAGICYLAKRFTCVALAFVSITIAAHSSASSSGNPRTLQATGLVIETADPAGGSKLAAIGGTRLRAIGGTRLRADDDAKVQAIGGTRLRAIGGTRLRAIGGTRLRAIGGTRLRAIGGTRLRADDDAEVQAIGGTRLRAIGGTRLRAIGGTRLRSVCSESDTEAIGGTRLRADDDAEVQAIGGTRLRAIGGTRLRAIGGTHLRAIGGTRLRTIADALGEDTFHSVYVGPIESIDHQSGVVSLVNQDVRLPGIVNGSNGVGPGDLVAIGRCDNDDESAIAYSVGDLFIAGSTEVAISGSVTEIDPEFGAFVIDNVYVDYSSLLSELTIAPEIQIGARVLVTGILY